MGYLLVKWRGLEESEASWEPLSTMAEDVPRLTAMFVMERMNKKLCKACVPLWKSYAKFKEEYSKLGGKCGRVLDRVTFSPTSMTNTPDLPASTSKLPFQSVAVQNDLRLPLEVAERQDSDRRTKEERNDQDCS